MSEPTIEQIKAWLRSLPGSMSAWSERDERMVGIIHRLIEQRPRVTREFVKAWAESIAGDSAINDIRRAWGKVQSLLRQAGVEVSNE